jgi:hypothetical protein
VSEVAIRGEGLNLVLVLERFERPNDPDEWIRARVSVELSRTQEATFAAQVGLALTLPDLQRFREALRTLLEDLTGDANLMTVEDQVEIQIALECGSGTIGGRIEDHAFGVLEFSGVPTDQSYLKSSALALDSALATFKP